MQVHNTETVYQGRFLRIRRDQVELRPGQVYGIELVDHSGAVAMLPLDDENHIHFVRQYRHPAGKFLLEIPAGTLEPGEDPLVTANRELQEEIGMRAAKLEKLSSAYMVPGYSSEYLPIYLATGLTPASRPGDEDEIIDVERIPVEQALQMLLAGEFDDAKTQLGLLWLARRIGDNGA